jgi:putative transcriptional regulator
MKSKLVAVVPERVDDDNPEWTAEDFAQARPTAEAFPEVAALFRAAVAQARADEAREAAERAARAADAIVRKGRRDGALLKTIRRRLGFNQERMAGILRISVSGYRKWEQGQRPVSGPARALLTVMDKEPEAVIRALSGDHPPEGTAERTRA